MKAVIYRESYGLIPGVPPATPAEVLLQGLNGRILEQYQLFTLVDLHVDQKDVLKERAGDKVEVRFREEFDQIYINGRVLDARHPEDTWPPGDTADPPYAEGEQGMWLIQFIGSISEEWMAAVEAEGVVPVQDLSYHAYIVAATNQQIRTVRAFRFIQWRTQMHRPVAAAGVGRRPRLP